jgi:hypothetical protein
MNVETLYPVLGLSATSLDVQTAFTNLDIDLTSELELPEDDFRAYIERPAAGVAFSFTDEAWFLGIADQPLRVGPLFFNVIFFYSDGVDGYSQYSHALPFGLTFSDDSGSARKKLGEPEWIRRTNDGKIGADRWEVSQKRRLHATYGPAGRLHTLIYSLPDANLRNT